MTTGQNDLQNLNFNDSAFQQLVDTLSETARSKSYHLSLFLGVYLPDKQKALDKIADATGLEIATVDFNELVSKSEEETFRNLDNFFGKHQNTDTILYFRNGDKLCGAYTGFSHSRVKYATPQERYFLKKSRSFQGIVIVDITEYTAADKTLRRASDSIVSFPLPDSTVQRFLWHLKNYTLHGFELRSKRPEAYGEVPGNF